MGRVVGGAARGTVDHGGRGHRLARMVLAGRDAGRRAGYRGQGELLHTGMRESISRGDSASGIGTGHSGEQPHTRQSGQASAGPPPVTNRGRA